MNTDPIADLLTRIRNAFMAKQENTLVPYSKIKENIIKIFNEKGFIEDYKIIRQGNLKDIKILLPQNRERLSLTRISKPGRRFYIQSKDIKPSVSGYGISIVSTSKGLMTGDEAKEQKLGGEVLCEIY